MNLAKRVFIGCLIVIIICAIAIWAIATYSEIDTVMGFVMGFPILFIIISIVGIIWSFINWDYEPPKLE